jgi:hypothetical protein
MASNYPIMIHNVAGRDTVNQGCNNDTGSEAWTINPASYPKRMVQKVMLSLSKLIWKVD